MMSLEILTIMIDFYNYWGFQVTLISDPAMQCQEIDLGFRRQMQMETSYQPLIDFMEHQVNENALYLYEDEFSINYFMFRIPKNISDADILCIGPILFQSIDTKGVQREVVEFYNQIPLCHSKEQWTYTLMFFLQKLYPESGNIPLIRVEKNGFPVFTNENLYSLPSNPHVALTAIEKRYQVERELMNAVSAGNIKEAIRHNHRFASYRLTPRSLSPLRDRKNLAFVFNTLLRKAAEIGGVHPLHIDNLSRTLAIQIENAMTLEQLEEICSNMIRKYCILVQNYARRSYSELTRTCMNYIEFYYNTELSLSLLADKCSVSPSHLSTVFSKDTRMTVTDYIHKTRIRQALILLNTTTLSIGEIASRCGFGDANYFSRIFRKYQGQSPQNYRNTILGTD